MYDELRTFPEIDRTEQKLLMKAAIRTIQKFFWDNHAIPGMAIGYRADGPERGNTIILANGMETVEVITLLRALANKLEQQTG